jgi:hypothetical protein
MELQIGDRLVDETGEWEVVGRPYTTAGGKNARVRVQRVGEPAVTDLRTWGAHERISGGRERRSEARSGILAVPPPWPLRVDATGVWTVVNLAFTAAATREVTMNPPQSLPVLAAVLQSGRRRAGGTFQTR